MQLRALAKVADELTEVDADAICMDAIISVTGRTELRKRAVIGFYRLGVSWV